MLGLSSTDLSLRKLRRAAKVAFWSASLDTGVAITFAMAALLPGCYSIGLHAKTINTARVDHGVLTDGVGSQ